jgi:transcriptional regulator with XRE-family HTH domain
MAQAYLDVAALYAALNEQKKARRLSSWRQVAKETGVSPSTLTRLAQGKRPDVDSLAALLHWLHMPAEAFMRGPEAGSSQQPEPMAAISALLRARKDLAPESAAALEDIIRAAYERLKRVQ